VTVSPSILSAVIRAARRVPTRAANRSAERAGAILAGYDYAMRSLAPMPDVTDRATPAPMKQRTKRPVPIQSVVLAWVRAHGPCTQAKIAAGTDLTVNQVADAIDRLVTHGDVISLRRATKGQSGLYRARPTEPIGAKDGQ
jgi:hypothetical protein